MKKHIVLITFLIIFSGQLSANQYKWDRIEIPYNIAEPGIVTYQKDIYLVGGRKGMSDYAPCSDQIWKYDSQSSNWQEMNGKLPYGMFTRNKCIVSGNKLIVSPSEGPNLQGGYGSHRKIVEYDFTSDIAVETAAYQDTVWDVTFGSFNINGDNRVYSFGGWNGGMSQTNKIYSYKADSTLQLVTTAVLCGSRAVTLIGYDLYGKAYLFGGNSAPYYSVEVFDPVTETISNLGNILPEGLNGEDSFAWTSSTGKIFIAKSNPDGKIYIFDPCDNSFTEASFGLPTPTAGFAIDYGTYNSATGSIYVIESKIWDGTDQFDSHIWIGTIPEPAIAAIVDIDPNTLNLQSKGKWITCYISFPVDVNVADVNSNTVLLNGTIKAEWMWVDEEEQVMMAKFSRSAVQAMLQPGLVELSVSGKLNNGTGFQGKDTITVINQGKP